MTVSKSEKKPSRIQLRNRKKILEAALEVFSKFGFRGSTLDQIALEAGLSKPNILYYFDGKEAIHESLLSQLLDNWLDPLREVDPNGEPVEELMGYVQRKLELSRDYPRESRLFANEVLQGAPRILPYIQGDLKTLVDEKANVISSWIDQGKIARTDPYHLIFSIWALTQHYADFDVQVRAVIGDADPFEGAARHLDTLFRKLLRP